MLVNGFYVKYVLKVSMYDDQYDYYVVGIYNLFIELFIFINYVLDIQYGLYYDYGKFYVLKFFYDLVKKCCIVWGWFNEFDSVV